MVLPANLLHPSGLPHAETLGLPIWAQWLVVAVVVAIGVWLVLDGREPRAGGAATDGGAGADQPPEWETGEALVVGRAARITPPGAAPRPAGVVDPRAEADEGGSGQPPARVLSDGGVRVEVAPGARLPLWLEPGTIVYVEAGRPDLACERGSLSVRRANLPRVGTPLDPSRVTAGRQVRLGVGDLVVALSEARIVARDATDRPALLLLFATTTRAGAAWLNPVRILTMLLGVGAGVLALDRARAVEALASFIGTGGGLNASRLGFVLAALFLVGGALAPTAPRASALAFAAAAGVAAFLASAARWEERLAWWGAEYVLTAWTRLPLWAAGGVALALLALGGWAYRPRRGPGRWGSGTEGR